MENDLLARICAELEQRMAELRPLLDEYERLLEAVDTLAPVESESGANEGFVTEAPVHRRAAPRLRSRSRRGSAAGALTRAASSLASAQTPTPPVVEQADYEPEPEPEPEHRRASSGDVRQAILAALEHGSHTVSELVMVTAMSPSDIRGSLRRLARQRKITKVKRQGDGKSAYALLSGSV